MSKHYICPVCRRPKSVELKDGLSLGMHLKLLSSTAFFMLLGYFLLGINAAYRLSFLYLVFWGLAEAFHWSHMRRLSCCKYCGFDPNLYLRDWRKAREKLETRLKALSDEIHAKKGFKTEAPAQELPEEDTKKEEKETPEVSAERVKELR